MTIHRVRAPTPGTTYNGFAESTPLTRGPLDRVHVPPPPQRRYQLRQIHRPDHRRRNLLLGGIGALAALGVALGLMAQPDLGWVGRAISTMPPPPPIDSAAPAEERAPAAPLPVEVSPAREIPSIPAIAVEPPPTIGAASPRRATPRPPPTRGQVASPPAPAAARVALVPPARAQISVAAPRRLVEPAPGPARAPLALPTIETPTVAAASPPPIAIRPGFNCAAAHNVSTRMVCADAELASYDRQLNGAFAAAIRAGVPRGELRADQDDWLQIREDAAHYSRQAVLNVYRQRISELNALARRPETYEGLGR